jgi:formylglycine-generating enzyme required for sulfatase activity
MVRLVLAVAAACTAAPAQQPPSEILLYVDTDAPMPEYAAPADAPTPLFDRVRIDVAGPAGAVASNDLELFADTLRAGASVGLALPVGAGGYVARVRLYRAAFATGDGEPDPRTTVDVTVALPPVQANVTTAITVMLPTSAVGVPSGNEATPVQPEDGAPSSSQVGTWPQSKPVPCRGMPLDDEVCIPGGAYWMGNPAAKSVLTGNDGASMRLVVLSPFFLKKTETTVGEYRASGLPVYGAWSGSTAGTGTQDWCTYTAAPRACDGGGPCDTSPTNCVLPSQARTFCQKRGGDLPTEAQYEYAAGGLKGRAFVWGEDQPTCPDAVYAQGGNGFLVDALTACPRPSQHGGPLPPGTGMRDRLPFGDGGEVLDLAGNLGEWARDTWNEQTEGCWAAPGIYTDPVCTKPSAIDVGWLPWRGGDWLTLEPLYAASRAIAYPGEGSIQIGFRCVRDASP